jgi:hypothetical protein
MHELRRHVIWTIPDLSREFASGETVDFSSYLTRLEIVALDFEPAEQLKILFRVHAFIKRYGIEYTYLIAGEPSQLNEKIPQAENLNAWPTTSFGSRNGLVRSVHAGFTSHASGELDSRLKEDVPRRDRTIACGKRSCCKRRKLRFGVNHDKP